MKTTLTKEISNYMERLIMNEQPSDVPANISEPNEIPIMMGFIDVDYEITDNDELAIVLLDADESGDKDQGFVVSFDFERQTDDNGMAKGIAASVSKIIQTSPIQRELSHEQVIKLIDEPRVSKILDSALPDIENKEAEKRADNEPDDYTGEEL